MKPPLWADERLMMDPPHDIWATMDSLWERHGSKTRCSTQWDMDRTGQIQGAIEYEIWVDGTVKVTSPEGLYPIVKDGYLLGFRS